MADVLQAMSIAGAILLLVVGLILVVSIAAVKRGEAAMLGDTSTKAWWNTGMAIPAVDAGAVAVKGAPAEEISVMQILAFGTGIFVLAVLLLFAISVLQHM